MKTQTQSTARLGASHGYRFDGDVVFLNASFIADASADVGRSWSLRLIAGDNHVVAEASLPPLAELTGAVENFEVAAPAVAPAARGFHTITLALVSRDNAGAESIQDRAVYDLAQSFAQPRLSGPVGLWFENDAELVLDVDHIENPRAEGNLSGTLSIEVWASDRAYDGGAVLGRPVAGAILGSLAAGQSWAPGALHLNAARPAAGSHLVVALREWNGSAYVTRDFVTFSPAPAPVAASVSAASSAPASSSVVAKAVETVKSALNAVVTAATEPVKAKANSAAKSKPAPKAPAAKAKAEKPAAKSAKSKKSSR